MLRVMLPHVEVKNFACPFRLCFAKFESGSALQGHVVRVHLLDKRCLSCGEGFVSYPEFLHHAKTEDCSKAMRRNRKRKQGQVEDEQQSAAKRPESNVEEPLNAFAVAAAADPVWVNDEEAFASVGNEVVLFPLDDCEMSADLLELLVADIGRDIRLSIATRLRGYDVFEAEFTDWWAKQDVQSAAADTTSGQEIARQLAHLCARGNVARSIQQEMFSILRRGSMQSSLPATFKQFSELVDERSHLIVETVICDNPPMSLFHIPLLLALPNVALEPDTVVQFAVPTEGEEQVECLRAFWHGDKFRRIVAAVGPDMSVVVWSLFVDKTRLVQHGTRKGHVVLACPLNNPRGRFDIVAFIPTITDEDATKVGLTLQSAVLMRAHLQQQALRVILLYGGFCADSPVQMLENVDGVWQRCRNVLGNVRADGEELCAVVSRVIAASEKHAKEMACYRHHIHSSQLSEVVANPDLDHRFYCQNAKYRAWFDELLSAAPNQSQEKTKTEFRRFGLIPIRPALFEAFLFDCAQDVVGDIQHVGPHGVGLFLLHHLAEALHDVFPDRDAEGTAVRDYIPEFGAVQELEMFAGEDVDVFLHLPLGVSSRAGFVWVRTVGAHEGFVPADAVSIKAPHDADFLGALKEFDRGLQRIGKSYVRSYKRFDFRSLEEASQSDSALFGRATTVEMVLLYSPFILSYVLRNVHGAGWIVETFLSYNRFYWNWRREVVRRGEGAVMETQRVHFKTLMKEHWTKYSRTGLNFMKFEQLDHVVHDLYRHSTVRYTGTGPGDNAHIRVAKIPFRLSNKTKDEAVLNKQLLSFGSAPCFLNAPAISRWQRSSDNVSLVGRGTARVLNHFVVEQMRVLQKLGWDSTLVNQPNQAVRKLYHFWCSRLGTSVNYLEFTAWKIRQHHAARIGTVEVCASDSYHKTSCHDFVRLRDGSICRLVALISLAVPVLGDQMIALVEETVVERVAELEVLGVPVISESDTWKWIDLALIVDVVCCLCHPSDRAWYFVIRNKRDENLWL